MEHHFPLNGFIPSSNAIRTKDWKYIRYTDAAAPFEELYDLRSDHHETRNLATDAKYTSQMAKLRTYCTTWKQSFAQTGAWTEPITAAQVKRDGLA